MKKLKIFFIVIFFMLLAIPVVTFRTEENAVSEVDNRMLAANPVSAIREGEDATQAIENYVNDRIGLRNEMIELYTVGHDKIFHEMIHPSYVYGKDGYVFLNTGGNPIFSDYHIAFADMIKKSRITAKQGEFRFYSCLSLQRQLFCRRSLSRGGIMTISGCSSFWKS